MIATIADATGNNICILACSFSVFVNGVFSMFLDFIAYLLIINNEIPIKIIFIAKKIILVLEYIYFPRRWEENGVRATRNKKIPLRFENWTSIFFAKTEAII